MQMRRRYDGGASGKTDGKSASVRILNRPARMGAMGPSPAQGRVRKYRNSAARLPLGNRIPFHHLIFSNIFYLNTPITI